LPWGSSAIIWSGVKSYAPSISAATDRQCSDAVNLASGQLA
jgi:hypothetical protein